MPTPERLNWKQLADLYDARNPGARSARTLHFDQVLRWAEKQPDIVYEPEGDYFYMKPPAPPPADKCPRTSVPKRFCSCLDCKP